MSSGPTCLSFCIAAYKEARTLCHIVENLRASDIWRQESFSDREILICVNGGDTATEAAARELEAKYPQVRAICIAEKGKILAWKELLAASSESARYLFFVDADVEVQKDSFTLLQQHLDHNQGVDICGAFPWRFPESKVRYGLLQKWYSRAYNTSEFAELRRICP